MKHKHFTHLLKPLFIILFALLIGEAGWGQTAIVSFDLIDNNAATEGTNSNKSSTVTTNATGIVSYDPTNGAQVDGWVGGANTKCWQTSFSTINFHTINVDYQQKSASDGPKDWGIYFSLDNITSVSYTHLTLPTIYSV